MAPKTKRSMSALIPYPGRTPPVDASHKMARPFMDVRTDTMECCRSRVSAPTESRSAAQFKSAIATQSGMTRSSGIRVPAGMTATARSQRTAAVAMGMRKPVLLSAPPWSWYSRSTCRPRTSASHAGERLRRHRTEGSMCRLGRVSRAQLASLTDARARDDSGLQANGDGQRIAQIDREASAAL